MSCFKGVVVGIQDMFDLGGSIPRHMGAWGVMGGQE